MIPATKNFKKDLIDSNFKKKKGLVINVIDEEPSSHP